MRALIIGDVHFDRWIEAERDPFAGLTTEDWARLDALFIAGDLSDKPRVRWKYAIRQLARHVDPGRIYIIPGNHDYYDFQIDRDDRLAEIAAREGLIWLRKRKSRLPIPGFSVAPCGPTLPCVGMSPGRSGSPASG